MMISKKKRNCNYVDIGPVTQHMMSLEYQQKSIMNEGMNEWSEH